MFHNLRWKLTAFNTAITGTILLCMTFLCLFISEENTRAQAYQNFIDEHNTVFSYLEVQSQISATWLRQMDSDPNTCISVRDAGIPLFSMGLSVEVGEMKDVFQQVRNRAVQEFSLDLKNGYGGNCSFSLKGANGINYFTGVSMISKNDSTLELITLYSLEEMESRISHQRWLFILIAMIAMAFLGCFSWIFTGKMLRPIQENQRRQTEFVAAASHELRTPLAAILSAASAMERSGPAQQAQFSDMIHKEGNRMSRLIGDMLTLASSDSKSWDIQMEDTELDMLLLDVYEAYYPHIRAKGLDLVLNLPDADIPIIKVDKDRIAQVITILLDNAKNYTPVPGCIQLGLDVARGSLMIIVSDTGPGVPDSEKEHIFERFYQGEKSRSNRSHFGLGLSIAAEIAQRHRGRIWVEDAPEGGAEFILELPLF